MFTKLIERNTTIRRARARPNGGRQPDVGRNQRSTRPIPLWGVFPSLVGISQNPGLLGACPQVEVTFYIDANGILNVTRRRTAPPTTSRRSPSARLPDCRGRGRPDGEGRRSDSADDRKNRDAIEARNRADAMIYNIQKTLKEHRDKVGEEEAKNIESRYRRHQEGDGRQLAIGRRSPLLPIN